MRNRTEIVKMGLGVVALAATCAAYSPPAAADTGSPPSSGPAANEPVNEAGTVRRLLRGPRGEVNGLLLTDGTIINVPPHVGDWLQRSAGEGSTVELRGYRDRDALGGPTLWPISIQVRGNTMDIGGGPGASSPGSHAAPPPPSPGAAPSPGNGNTQPAPRTAPPPPRSAPPPPPEEPAFPPDTMFTP
jgi:hypothetical protein